MVDDVVGSRSVLGVFGGASARPAAIDLDVGRVDDTIASSIARLRRDREALKEHRGARNESLTP
jgi:hypothetical protein